MIADKPPLSDLPYFLDFQSHKSWAPVHNDLPLGPSTNVASSSSALHLNFLGPKLYVNTSQVTAKPVISLHEFSYNLVPVFTQLCSGHTGYSWKETSNWNEILS